MSTVRTPGDGQPEGVRQGEEPTEVFHLLREGRPYINQDDGGLEVDGTKICTCGVVSESHEQAENVKAIFLTYIVVLSLLPFYIGAGIAFYLGGWKATIGILVWIVGVYLMLVGMYLMIRKWLRRKRPEST